MSLTLQTIPLAPVLKIALTWTSKQLYTSFVKYFCSLLLHLSIKLNLPSYLSSQLLSESHHHLNTQPVKSAHSSSLAPCHRPPEFYLTLMPRSQPQFPNHPLASKLSLASTILVSVIASICLHNFEPSFLLLRPVKAPQLNLPNAHNLIPIWLPTRIPLLTSQDSI